MGLGSYGTHQPPLDFQQIQPKSKTQLSSTGRLVSEQPPGLLTNEIEKDVLFGCESTNSRTVRPVKSCVPVPVERVDKEKDADENVDADQTSTVRPVYEQPPCLFTQLEEIDIDFRVSGLPHAVVKQAELVKKIESHPHRRALQADLQQNNAYNPLSEESKVMIREMGNVELFELCETCPKVQCSECLLYWNQGVIYCTCGHLLVQSELSQFFRKWRLDALSIPHYVIKKVRQKCIAMDKLAQEDHSHSLRYQKHWYLTLRRTCRTTSFQQYQRWHPSASSSSWWNWDKSWWSS